MVIGGALPNENIPTEPAGPALPAAAFDTPSFWVGENTNAAARLKGRAAGPSPAPSTLTAFANEKTEFARGVLPTAAFDMPSFWAGEKVNAAAGDGGGLGM